MRVILSISFLSLFLYSCGGGGGDSAPETAKQKAPNPPKITLFYGNANLVPRGNSVTLCYGTEDATEVTLTPYKDTIKPSYNRCVEDKPVRDTTYTLTAKGPGGETSQSFAIKMGPPEAKQAAGGPSRTLIQSFNFLGEASVAAGTPVQFCYSTAGGVSSVTVQPKVASNLKPGANQCFTAPVSKTTNYILTATAADGAVDRMQVTVRTK